MGVGVADHAVGLAINPTLVEGQVHVDMAAPTPAVWRARRRVRSQTDDSICFESEVFVLNIYCHQLF